MQRLLIAVTFVFIILRGYFYFTDAQIVAAVLDLFLLPLYVFACMIDRRWIYISVVAYLPGSSVFYLATGLIPFDLSLVVILLASTVLCKDIPVRRRAIAIKIALFVYALLCTYLFINMFYESLITLDEVTEQTKVLYLLLSATVAAFLFGKIYDSGDSVYIQNAITLGVAAYIVAGCVGYLFPLSTYTWQLETEFHFKSLFRYPGMSSSNYIAHVLLMLLAIHKYVSDQSGKSTNIFYYLSSIALIAVVSQSRSFAVTATALILSWWVLHILREGGGRRHRHAGSSNRTAYIAVGLISIASVVIFSDFFLELGRQTLNRLSFSDYSSINVTRRLGEWHQAFEHFDETGRSMIRGNLSYPDNLRPHNVFLGAALVFGVPTAIIVVVLFVALVGKYPILVFVFLAAQAEILFVTGIYDFIFMIFVTILCSRQTRTGERTLIVSSWLPRQTDR